MFKHMYQTGSRFEEAYQIFQTCYKSNEFVRNLTMGAIKTVIAPYFPTY